MKKAIILLCALACLLFVIACVPKECRTNEDCVPAEPMLGVQYVCEAGKCVEKPLGNPAAMFCLQNGGRVEARAAPEGAYGVCVFQDGSECEEWAFYRGECAPGESLPPPAPVEPKIELMSCEQYDRQPGQICPTTYDPVCAKIEMTTGVRWITFNNPCLACKMSARPATRITYKTGLCE